MMALGSWRIAEINDRADAPTQQATELFAKYILLRTVAAWAATYLVVVYSLGVLTLVLDDDGPKVETILLDGADPLWFFAWFEMPFWPLAIIFGALAWRAKRRYLSVGEADDPSEVDIDIRNFEVRRFNAWIKVALYGALAARGVVSVVFFQ